ncbi:MAG TPA: RtcB family protein [Pyrinomonadaceae bacterium]|nr:RtcB family protein [Pyrinomonadaceae bacterium]
MPYNKLNISGANADVLSWVNHALSTDEHNMLRNVSRLPCLYKHVALMPDAHLGIGSMVGSVIATKDAVIPATVGVDIGCFTGDTLVPTLDGKSYSLRELAEKGEEIVVYACTESGKVVAAKATAKKTRANAELVKVMLDNGEEIRCTPDHKFMLRDGSFVEAKDLEAGTSLMPFYRAESGSGFVEVKQNYATAHNHKVVSVEKIAEREDVYCLTVPEYHNFALEAGVFVHNCGMAAIKTPFKSGILDGKLKELRHQIERTIPVGFNDHNNPVDEAFEWEAWSEFGELHKGVQDRKQKAMKQLGTLGGGNHFCEVCLDTEDNVWLMLHSGSRNIGNEIASRHINTAKSLHKLNELPDPNLAYFIQGTEEFRNYWHDLEWAQAYAMKNREVMMKRLLYQFNRMFNDGEDFTPEITVNCHHNYVALEHHYGEDVYVTRKGAINAEQGRYGIIPGSMGAKSFIIKGLGNPQSYNSCSHGAGRKMSRTQAKKHFTQEDLERQTAGVECRKDRGVIDEIPGAYKDIDEVMRNQTDLVEIVAELKQVVCVKG